MMSTRLDLEMGLCSRLASGCESDRSIDSEGHYTTSNLRSRIVVSGVCVCVCFILHLASFVDVLITLADGATLYVAWASTEMP
jgi:hypothetical protein